MIARPEPGDGASSARGVRVPRTAACRSAAQALQGRRRALVALAGPIVLSACAAPAERMEATVHWAGSDLAFTTGLPRFDEARSLALLAFLPRPPSEGAPPVEAAALGPWLAAREQPYLLLELAFRASGRARFENLLHYGVRIGSGVAHLRVERRATDWVRDGGIDLSGDARAGGRLLGRLRRAGADAGDTTARPWRWDIGFDTRLVAG